MGNQIDNQQQQPNEKLSLEVVADPVGSDNLKSMIGGRLKEARKAIGLTQKALCETIGMPLPSLRDYELGNRIPGGEALAMLAQAGIDLNWLITGVRYMTNEAGELFFEYQPVKPLPDGLSLTELEDRKAEYAKQEKQIKAMLDFHNRARSSTPKAAIPAPKPTPLPQINIDALVQAFCVSLQTAPKGETQQQSARKAIEFYLYCVERGLITPEGQGPGDLKDVA